MRRLFRHLGTIGICGAGPTHPVVPFVTPGIREPLISRREGIHCLAAHQLHTGHNEVQLDVAHVDMAHPQDVVLVRLQASKNRLLQVVHHGLDLRLGGAVGVGKRHHPAAVLPLVRDRVDQGSRAISVATKHLGRRITVGELARDSRTGGREFRNHHSGAVLSRPGATTGATVKQLDEHRHLQLAAGPIAPAAPGRAPARWPTGR